MYIIVAFAPATVNPAPSAVAEFVAFLAIVMLRSVTSNVAVSTVVVVPLTVRSPVKFKSLNVTSLVVDTSCPIENVNDLEPAVATPAKPTPVPPFNDIVSTPEAIISVAVVSVGLS